MSLRAPEAADDNYTTTENDILSVPNSTLDGPLANDMDIDGNQVDIRVTSFEPVSKLGAVVELDALGNLTYDPTEVAAFQSMTDVDFITGAVAPI